MANKMDQLWQMHWLLLVASFFGMVFLAALWQRAILFGLLFINDIAFQIEMNRGG